MTELKIQDIKTIGEYVGLVAGFGYVYKLNEKYYSFSKNGFSVVAI